MRYQHDVLRLPCGDQTTPIDTPGTVHGSFMPYPMTVTGVRASLKEGPTSGTLLVDVEEEGVSILAAPIALTAGVTSSTGMSSLPFIVDDVLGDAARIEVIVIDEASGDAVGLTVDILGHRWVIPFAGPYGLSGPSGEGVGLPVVPNEPPPPPLTVTINQASGQADPAIVSPIVFDVVFSEAVTGFATGDVTLSGTAGGTLVGTVAGSGATYTVSVTGMTTAGTVIATIPAGVCTSGVLLGRSNEASTSTDNTVTWPALAVFDSFDRANSSTSPGVADSGQTWSVTSATWGIISNEAYQAANIGGGGDKTGIMKIDTGLVACTIEVDITAAQAGNSVGAGIAFRCHASSVQDLFLFMFYKGGAGSLNWFLQKSVGGVFTTLANGTPGAVTGTLKVVDTGSSITCYINGASVTTQSDTALNTNQRQGLMVTYTPAGGANDGTGWRFNDYSVV